MACSVTAGPTSKNIPEDSYRRECRDNRAIERYSLTESPLESNTIGVSLIKKCVSD